VEDRVEDIRRRVAAKRKRSGGHFIEHGAKRKQVCACVGLFTYGLLRGHVGNGAESGAGTGERIGFGERDRGRDASALRDGTNVWSEFSETKIEDFGVAIRGDEDVGGLDVAVDDALGMSSV